MALTNWLHVSVVASLVLLICGDETSEPRVAFLCGLPAMHSTQHGKTWVKDDATGCLKNPTEILNYCRKVYPTLDISNVVESTEKVKISNWCDIGVSICNKEISVAPFRCLVGSFQSDALLVPEQCVFDHIHDSKLCTSFTEWSKTSLQACTDRGMVQQSFAMLQPCGIDRFSGVEFVCCPNKQDAKDRSNVEFERKQPMEKQPKAPVSKPLEESESSETNSDGSMSDRYAQKKKPQTQDMAPESLSVESESTERSRDDSSVFGRYIQKQTERGAGRQWNEHDYFIRAKDDMQKHHHDKIAKMMKDWAAARQRVQQLKATDPKQSEKLNKDITKRFQKMYEAEEVESDMEREQLKQLHQQRVQADIIEKKEQAFDDYANALSDPRPDASEILRSLKRYVKTLHKDRMHTINHYEHVEDTEPEEADKIHAETAQHLRLIDQQLTDALNMLSRKPGLKNKIKQQIQPFIDAYHSMDRDAGVILLTQPTHKQVEKQQDSADEDIDEDDVNSDDDEDDEDEDVNDVKSKSTENIKANDKKNYKERDDEEEQYEDDAVDSEEDMEDERIIEVPVPDVKPHYAGEETKINPPKADSEVAVDYYHLPSKDRHSDAANVHSNVFAADQAFVDKSQRSAESAGLSSAVPVAIAVGTLTVIAVIILLVVISRRRQHAYQRPLRLNLDPIGEEASPEEKHVSSMQMNGYVNPTYKFFEQRGSTA